MMHSVCVILLLETPLTTGKIEYLEEIAALHYSNFIIVPKQTAISKPFPEPLRNRVRELSNLEAQSETFAQIISKIPSDWVIVLSSRSEPATIPNLDCVGSATVIPLVPTLVPPIYNSADYDGEILEWIGRTEEVCRELATVLISAVPTFAELVDRYECNSHEIRWGSAHVRTSALQNEKRKHGFLTSASRVLTFIPHFKCERYLDTCLRSIIQQDQKPEHIVVIDDASPTPPTDIVREFPDVTLLRSSVNVGPETLLQAIADVADYDGIMIQDADDWAAVDRLKILLNTCEQYSGDYVGSYELRITEGGVRLRSFPVDVNSAIQGYLGHCLLHGSSLIATPIIRGIGGFSTGLSVAADTEFLHRAVFAARVLNAPAFAYFRRSRPDSLTTSKDTGLDSPLRMSEKSMIRDRAVKNMRAAQASLPVDISPLAIRKLPELAHLLGPKLRRLPV